jgi:hypothetical protein
MVRGTVHMISFYLGLSCWCVAHFLLPNVDAAGKSASQLAQELHVIPMTHMHAPHPTPPMVIPEQPVDSPVGAMTDAGENGWLWKTIWIDMCASFGPVLRWGSEVYQMTDGSGAAVSSSSKSPEDVIGSTTPQTTPLDMVRLHQPPPSTSDVNTPRRDHQHQKEPPSPPLAQPPSHLGSANAPSSTAGKATHHNSTEDRPRMLGVFSGFLTRVLEQVKSVMMMDPGPIWNEMDKQVLLLTTHASGLSITLKHWLLEVYVDHLRFVPLCREWMVAHLIQNSIISIDALTLGVVLCLHSFLCWMCSFCIRRGGTWHTAALHSTSSAVHDAHKRRSINAEPVSHPPLLSPPRVCTHSVCMVNNANLASSIEPLHPNEDIGESLGRKLTTRQPRDECQSYTAVSKAFVMLTAFVVMSIAIA